MTLSFLSDRQSYQLSYNGSFVDWAESHMQINASKAFTGEHKLDSKEKAAIIKPAKTPNLNQVSHMIAQSEK